MNDLRARSDKAAKNEGSTDRKKNTETARCLNVLLNQSLVRIIARCITYLVSKKIDRCETSCRKFRKKEEVLMLYMFQTMSVVPVICLLVELHVF